MNKPGSAMIFAAGFGTRMRPLTDARPKPLIHVAGKPLIDHALTLAQDAEVKAVVNAHHKADMIAKHLKALPNTDVIVEMPVVLDTGGGLKNARAQLGSDPVFTLNSDAVWAGPNPLELLAQNWRTDMDALLLLVPIPRTVGYTRAGNFALDMGNRITRNTDGLVYTGAQILRTERLDEIERDVFSLNLLWDRFLADGTAFGVEYPGHWADVGTPDGIGLAEAMLKDHAHV